MGNARCQKKKLLNMLTEYQYEQETKIDNTALNLRAAAITSYIRLCALIYFLFW